MFSRTQPKKGFGGGGRKERMKEEIGMNIAGCVKEVAAMGGNCGRAAGGGRLFSFFGPLPSVAHRETTNGRLDGANCVLDFR